MSMPKRLVVEYEDGSTKAVDFNQLSRICSFELSKLGVWSPSPVVPKLSKNYLLLQWQDGWQEVVGVDESPIEFLRYYVLERVDTVGRMALKVEDEYPTLLLIRRKPKDLDSAVIIGSDNAAVYISELKVKKEGDKTEHIRYDRAEKSSQQPRDYGLENRITKILDSLKTDLDKRGLNANELLQIEPDQRIKEYQEIAKTLGIRASEKQDDVYCFMQLMVENLASVKNK